MKRRSFIRSSLSATMLPLLVNGLPVSVFGQDSWFASQAARGMNNKKLVLVQLFGGNDGLNTLIPLDKYAQLVNARKNIMIPEDRVLPINGTAVTGLHPAMKGIQSLYNSNLLSFIQGVGYPEPDFSHFRSTQIKLTGSDAKTVLATGWVGRYLDDKYPSFPKGYPNNEFPDPPAIKLGATASNALLGKNENLGVTIANAATMYQIASGEDLDLPPMTPAGDKMSYIGQTTELTNRYSKVIKAATDKRPNIAKYPETGVNLLADQLRIVAQMIGAGMTTKVYVVYVSGFDTHIAQVDKQDTTKGTHADLLNDLSEAVSIFMDDIHQMGKQDEVLGMTFSDFGRRIVSNASYGTDHGSSEVVLLFGSKLIPGIHGTNPIIPDKAVVEDNLAMQHDFRAVYASVLKGWFEVPEDELTKAILGQYPTLDLFRKS